MHQTFSEKCVVFVTGASRDIGQSLLSPPTQGRSGAAGCAFDHQIKGALGNSSSKPAPAATASGRCVHFTRICSCGYCPQYMYDINVYLKVPWWLRGVKMAGVAQCAVQWLSDQGGQTCCVCKAVVSLGKTLHLNLLLWVLSTVDHYMYVWSVCVKRFESLIKHYNTYKDYY